VQKRNLIGVVFPALLIYIVIKLKELIIYLSLYRILQKTELLDHLIVFDLNSVEHFYLENLIFILNCYYLLAFSVEKSNILFIK
jgi:hypothetical protein